MSESKRPPEEHTPDKGYTPASPVKRTMAWIGVVYMVILVAMMTYYYFTGSMLVNMAPLLAVPGLIGLGILALVSWRTTGRPGKWPAIALACVVFICLQLKPLKKVHPIVFIALSAVAGIVFKL